MLKTTEKRSSLPTGLASLDLFLAGGWPAGGMTVLSGEKGCGKTELALRAAAEATKADRWVALVSAGETLFPPSFSEHGVDLARLLWVRPKEEIHARWALEQLTRSGLFTLVLASHLHLGEKEARRLQLGSEQTGAAALLLTEPIQTNLWALTLHCEVARSSDRILVLKVRRSRKPLSRFQTEVNLDEKPNSGDLSSQPAVRIVAS
ncbi:MAG: ATPase domain-containing protein [Pseudomonadota bacterium]